MGFELQGEGDKMKFQKGNQLRKGKIPYCAEFHLNSGIHKGILKSEVKV
jgi:hypothetical protein